LILRLGLAADARVFDAAPDLRWLLTPTTGLDHIDCDAAAVRGVEVLSLRGHTDFLETIDATAEHTWALLLALCRKLPAAYESVQRGQWDRAPFLGTELAGRTLGVIGHGRLGRKVAGYGRAFGMRVIVHDIDEQARAGLPPGAAVTLSVLLREADVITLHVHLDARTRGMLGPAEFAAMKQGALIVNTARGELIDDDALVACLRRGQVAGAAVDVVADDSRWNGTVPAGQPLLEYARTATNVVVTPHLGGYAVDAVRCTRSFLIGEFGRRIDDEDAR
jgi:D-3-phosphoglycerate dehydrogenase